jgi:preprotein translocase SecE subunit
LQLHTVFNPFLATSLLLIVTVLAGLGLCVLVLKYEEQNSLHGRRAGAVVGAIFLYFAFRLTFGFGNRLASNDLGAVGLGLMLAAGAGMLFILFWLFKKPGFGSWLKGMEDHGWFNFSSYKGNQGVKVRRFTVIGLLVGGVAGIVTMGSNRTLGSELPNRPNNWELTVPFTGPSGDTITAMKNEVKALEKKVADKDQPQDVRDQAAQKLAQANRELQASSPLVIPLMFKIHWVVPIVLSGVLLWWVWRLVNQPTFADFLIATEAEINKVSWTTRKRLVQDTIVVLVTVFLMTVFLLVVDLVWINVLKSPWIHVLRVDTKAELAKQMEKTQW